MTEADPFKLFYTQGPNGSQPATYPGVHELRITALADDSHPFPWPVVVRSHHESLPVTVQDVMRVLLENFSRGIWQQEFDEFSENRRERILTTYWSRMEKLASRRISWFVEEQEIGPEPLRRLDYLGERTWFRGLEPAPDGESFAMFVGPPI